LTYFSKDRSASPEVKVMDTDGEDHEAKGQVDDEEEEDPHQQSFLSFLNLKPGGWLWEILY